MDMLCSRCICVPGLCCSLQTPLFSKPPYRRAGMFYHFKDPVMITEGRMQYLYDETGRRYLDVRALRCVPICASAMPHTHCKLLPAKHTKLMCFCKA